MWGGKLISPLGQLRGPVAAGGRFLLISVMPAHILSVLITVAIYGSAPKRFQCSYSLLPIFDQELKSFGKQQSHNFTVRYTSTNNINAIVFICLILCFLQNIYFDFCPQIDFGIVFLLSENGRG